MIYSVSNFRIVSWVAGEVGLAITNGVIVVTANTVVKFVIWIRFNC
ncbi:hypothetical protein ABIE54_002680 [Chitinophagaceae bacterium OAS944]